MKLDEVIGRLSTEEIEAISGSSVWQPIISRGIAWHEAMRDRECAAEAASRLSRYAKEVLKTMLLRFGAEPAEEEKLLSGILLHSILAKAECKAGLTELVQCGVLFAVKKVWGERMYFMPVECFWVWQQAFFPFHSTKVDGRIKPIATETGGYAVVKEPFGRKLLYMLAQLAQSESAFTAKGVLSKKTIAKLEQSLELDEGLLRQSGLRWTLGEHYPLAVAAAFFAASEFGLVRRHQDGMEVAGDGLNRWLQVHNSRRERMLQERLCGCLLQSLGAGAGAHFASAALSLPAGAWHCSDEVSEYARQLMAALSPIQHISDANNRIEEHSGEQWLLLLSEFGWIELAETETGSGSAAARVFRWKAELDEELDELIVQPNGELIAGAGTRFAVRWELELIARRLNGEEPIIYRLEPERVGAAVELGRTKETIVRFLEEACGGEPLPTTVAAMLEEWTKKACRYSFSEVTLLICDSPEQAELALSMPELAPFLLQRLGENDILVDASSVGEIRRLLQKAGYPPRKGIGAGSTEVAGSYPFISISNEGIIERVDEIKAEAEAGAWIYEPFSMRHFEMERLPEADVINLEAAMEKLPAAWWKQLRNYHGSTRKEMMQQAVSIGMAVQLRVLGELRFFVPDQVEQRGAEWGVTGRMISGDWPEPIRLTPDMWEEMKIIVPGGGAG
ncbi:helicase-associated domain-containing protein [Paenibacillus sp. GCM10027627]|uniref:helicase-associated domain-containing protein n=1 Tax=unclassified Paenibacillus TaxID=185978 RepID=UPI0036282BCC